MNLVVVSNDRSKMRLLTNSILNETSDYFINEFVDPMKVPKYVSMHRVVAAFIDIKMKPLNGIELSNALKMREPLMCVYLIGTDYAEYEEEIKLADGVIHMPFCSENLKQIIVKLSKSLIKY